MRSALRLLALMSVGFLPLFAQTGPASAERRIEITENADYFGFDLRTVQNISLDDCKAICLGDSQCKAFTFNVKAGWCFLKSDYRTINPFNGAIAGKVTETGGAPDIGSPPDLAFLEASVLDEARAYRERLLVRYPDAASRGAAAYLTDARRAQDAGNTEAAVRAFAAASAADPDRSESWTSLSRAALAFTPNDADTQRGLRSAAISAAIQGYQTSRTQDARFEALAAMGTAFDRSQIYRPALDAWKSALDVKETPGLRAAYADLRKRQGFRVIANSVDADSETPRACVQFSENLETGTDYTGFVSLEGKSDITVDASGREICVDGLSHGERYRMTLRAGLPSAIGENLEAPVELTLYVRDRAPAARFTGSNFVLPAKGRLAIPLVTVNAPSADLRLYRIGERALSNVLVNSEFLTQLDSYSVERLGSDVGEPVWQGSVEIAVDPNREVTTGIPVDEMLAERRAGVYVLSAVPAGDKSERWDAKATQWFVVSDTGLSAYTGEDGLTVFLRSLSDAKPLSGASLTLIARNNEILGEATSDRNGSATFEPGLTRGLSGLAPAALIVRHGEDDFTFLDLTRPGFDLADRGVGGRPAPGGVDIYATTERGIYRAGETVHLTAVARDGEARALSNLPLTLILQRPDGFEDRRIISGGEALGGHVFNLDLPGNAMQGTWQAFLHTDPKREAVTQTTFLVEDFRPDRIEIEVTSGADAISLDEPTVIDVTGRWLYGAPAAGLSTEGEIVLSRSRTLAAYPGFEFGLEDEEFEDSRLPLESLSDLDEEGKAEAEISLGDLPSTTQFLQASVTVRASEDGGRAVERTIALPVRPDGPRIGIDPAFEDGQAGENALAAFRVIAIDENEARIPVEGVSWSLKRIERNYQWYRSGNGWNYEVVDFSTEIADGTIDLTADRAADIAAQVAWGRYRLDVTAPDGTEASLVFDAGWYVESVSTETPDGLEIALDKDRYAIGETARLRISPRFAGEALVIAGSGSIKSVQTVSVPEDGATVDIPVTDNFGAGAYVSVTLYRPGSGDQSRLPARAIGLKWLSVDPGERRLAVSLDLPGQALPREPLNVPVTLAGLRSGEKAYVAVAAVDVGILNLTRHPAPDPSGWFFGQRALGLAIRDVYGKLIDGSLGALGRLRTGGDGPSMRAQGSPPKEALVAFFAGPVEVDADGKALVTFDMPQFNGTVRVSAMAWSGQGIGEAVEDVIVRDPVVITASLPQFLAPGDRSTLLVSLANTDAPSGDYALEILTSGASVSAGTGERMSFPLEAGARTSFSLPLEGITPGTETVTVMVNGPDGLQVSREEIITVRPPTLPQTEKRIVSLAANGGSLRIDGELFGGSLREGATLSVGISRNADFDVTSALLELDRYPLGCAEQTVSRALPLLYLSELGDPAAASGTEMAPRIDSAITRLVSYQSASGSFGLWGPGSGDLWLDAYVSDFLTRASEKGFAVPPKAAELALGNLQNTLAYSNDLTQNSAAIAYALYVLARNGKAAATDLRYYADSQINAFTEPLSRAQLGAALALYGDSERAGEAFASAYRQVQSSAGLVMARSDYGSTLRDGAGILALAAETTPRPGLVDDLIGFVGAERARRSQASTQENAWMVLAARAIASANRAISLDVDGKAYAGAWNTRKTADELDANPMLIVNRGSDPVDAVITTSAAQETPLPAGGNGFTIMRSTYTLDGQPASIANVRQNDRFVVVLEMSEANAWVSEVSVIDLLPAGFVIDNPRLVGSAELSGFDWLGPVSASHSEFRSDRFVAAFSRSSGSSRSFNAAYVVRAVTPGIYAHPAAIVEDMYRPELQARTAAGLIEVTAAQ